MNKWKEIWDKRQNFVDRKSDIFDMFVELKKADGFDIQQSNGYYESFYEQFNKMTDIISDCVGNFESVYEVGCGSGVNLFLFDQLLHINKVGGCDYSQNLIDIARTVVDSKDISCIEAKDINLENYDIVLSDSVFQYFHSEDYGLTVLGKMYSKANKMVIIREIHDKNVEEEHLEMRRNTIENYDAKYEGLGKTFYNVNDFVDFAKNNNCKYKIIKPDNYSYWNNNYVFDFYLIKN